LSRKASTLPTDLSSQHEKIVTTIFKYWFWWVVVVVVKKIFLIVLRYTWTKIYHHAVERDGSAVKSICCSYRGPDFGSQRAV
jgi:type II secretory pathway component PulL